MAAFLALTDSGGCTECQLQTIRLCNIAILKVCYTAYVSCMLFQYCSLPTDLFEQQYIFSAKSIMQPKQAFCMFTAQMYLEPGIVLLFVLNACLHMQPVTSLSLKGQRLRQAQGEASAGVWSETVAAGLLLLSKPESGKRPAHHIGSLLHATLAMQSCY